MGETPVDGLTLDIPGTNGQLSTQVFEYSRLFCFIRIPNTGQKFHMVKHPLSGAMVRRNLALNFVNRVSAETQNILNQERLRMILTLLDDTPLNEEDHERYNIALQRMASR